MKILLLVTLAILAVHASGAYIQETRQQEGTVVVTTLSAEEIEKLAKKEGEFSRSRNLNVGVIGPNDRGLYWGRFSATSASFSQEYTISFTSLSQNTITAFLLTEVGATQFASTSVVSGGVGSNNVIIRVITAPGHGFNYELNVWGY